MNITQSQLEKIKKIAQHHNVEIVVLFGSQITGKSHSESDVDIGIVLADEPHSYHVLLGMRHALRDVFPAHNIDVRYLHGVTPLFLFESVYKGQLLYGSEYAFAKLCAKAFKGYVETQPLRELQEQMIIKRQEKLVAA